ncbi:RNA-guided endonuclease InsQ/TnpB family protein [Lusitaniella coriacea]|uniref:RNA-guided endonuclease InsQ/TnpB family protein n=1 Tax=Lusitaniella coriacea TaxID=1983105 RepID=UPI003CEBBD23
MIYVYQYRLYPTPSQTLELNDWLRVCQYWYNRQLGERFDWWDMNRCYIDRCPLISSVADLKVKPTQYGQQGQLPGLKKDYQFVRSSSELLDFSRVPANTLQAICKQVETSFKRFTAGDKNGKRSGKPRFKNRARFRTLNFTGSQKGKFSSIGYFGAFVITKKLGELKVRMHRPLPDGATLKTSSVTKKADGWYLNVTLDDPSVPEPVTEVSTWDNSLGIDAVLKGDDYLALSTGDKLPSLKPLRKSTESLTKVSQAKSSAKRGSRKRRKLARREAGIHQKIARQRKQHRYETAHSVVNTGAKNIFVEKLNLAGLKKRNKVKQDDTGKFLPNGQASKSGLNKSWSDAAFGMFLDTLSVVASKAGASVHKVNPAYTSKVLCYRNIVAFDSLSAREYRDTELGLTVDRDINAALNIKQRGLQVFPVPKKASKRKGIKIVRDLERSTVTAMVDVFRRIDQAHTTASVYCVVT